MAKYRPHIVFVLLMVVYFVTRWYRSSSENDFISYYLTDLLFVPTMCTFALIGVRVLKRNSLALIPWYFVLIQTVFVAVYFEWYLPVFHGKPGWYTSDLVDVVMYFMGAILYLVLQKYLFSQMKTKLA